MELYVILENRVIGKTYSCIKRIIEVMNSSEEFLLITNVTSFKVFYERTLFIENLYEMIDTVNNYCENPDFNRRIIIFFDEIFTVVNKNYAVDDTFMSFISQLRKRHIILFTTAQEWTEINISFRRYVRFQISCRMFAFPLTKTAFLFNYINDGENLKLNPQTMEYEAPVINTKIMKGNKSVIDSYDTYQVIKVGRKTTKKNKYINYIGDVNKMA